MIGAIKNAIQNVVNKFGYDIIKLKNYPSKQGIYKWVNQLDIGEVIDIGANIGLTTRKFAKIIPSVKVFAIEPIKNCFDELIKNTRGLNVEYFNVGVGEEESIKEINISANSVSSSLLPMEELHLDHYAESKYIRTESITVKTLDTLLKDRLDPSKNLLVKIDVQGYEDKVVAGGKQVLNRASCIIIESSFSVLYSDQWLFADIYKYFTENGFTFLGLDEQVLSKNGIPLFCDAIFVKSNLISKIY